ncbi:kinesin motor domain protein, putative (macronuclear) [Tetrahymena thermophila SB210]|uniref:Kinesin motor domain protein, putative n=1 Tax=Tetrahymena thermophila (strain SB210) TaxID=312017 RepID=W7XHN2_TETTS|nr:kinesin motor domain protein, putative [Tetrahymena thermophila SB210]EWS72654.1 kinesin motor domain protein, putative [Tetrahymena thermophila SB210]|eukprot:XP_012654822.1 kinesin motor domain protein, putative [Tetrahymena thermophila SB210]
MSIDAPFKNKLKLKKPFSIYNIHLGKTIDINAPKGSFYHMNFNKYQSFTFEIINTYPNQDFFFGHLVIDEKILFFNLEGNCSVVKKGKGYENQLILAIRRNDQGIISIHQVQNDRIINTITWNNQKFKFDKTTQPSFEWYFLQKQTTELENKAIIVTSLKNINYAISSKPGQRFVELEIFNMYNKQDYAFKAKIQDQQKYFYCLEQLNGENCMTATNKIVQNQPFQKELSEWTIIKNVAKEEYFFLSMKVFNYLTNIPEPAGLQLDAANFISGNQSFKIEDYSQRNKNNDYIQASEENIEEENHIDQRHNINQMNNKQEYRFKSSNSSNHQANSMLNQSYLAQQGKNTLENNSLQLQQNQISQSLSSQQQKFGSILHSVDAFKSGQQQPQEQNQIKNQFQKVVILNQGSKQYLKLNNYEVIETNDQKSATKFQLVPINSSNEYYIQLFDDNKKILGSHQDIPVTPIKILDKSSYSQEKFQMISDNQSCCVFKQKNSYFQIIGGKLFKSELKQNNYNKFIIQQYY